MGQMTRLLESRIALGTATRSCWERAFSLCAPVKPGEGSGVALMAGNAFVLLLAYYLLKPVRETLILIHGGAEVRSYAAALQAVLLLSLLPAYTRWVKARSSQRVIQGVSLFFLSNLVLFWVLGRSGVPVAVPFFVWLGIFSIAVVSQFWVFAADLYQVNNGQRTFVLIMAGASFGAFVGARISAPLAEIFGPWGLMLLAGSGLLVSIRLGNLAATSVLPIARRGVEDQLAPHSLGQVLTALWRDVYLRLIALCVLLLNCINSTGEYMLARWVVERASEVAAVDGAITPERFISSFYADFYSWVCLLNFAIQLLLVSRIFRIMGIKGALLVLPILCLAGYGVIALLPLFALTGVVKVLENSIDYSLQNTVRQVLFLPASRFARIQGKTVIETVIWRCGDLLNALVVYLGATVLGLGIQGFAFFNAALAFVWLLIAGLVGRHHANLTQSRSVL